MVVKNIHFFEWNFRLCKGHEFFKIIPWKSLNGILKGSRDHTEVDDYIRDYLNFLRHLFFFQSYAEKKSS